MASKAVFNARKLDRHMKEAALKSLDLVTIALQKKIRQRLSKAGSGEKYPGSSYRSSAEGEPPAVQSGQLRNSWIAGSRVKVRQFKKVSVILNQGVSFGAAAKYGFWLEYGTSRMLPRPFVEPTVSAFKSTAPAVFTKRFKKLVKEIDDRGPYA